MKWFRSTIFFTILSSSILAGGNSADTNEIDAKEAVKNLDPSIRQALLRAIDNLEKRVEEDDEYEDEESLNANDNDEVFDESLKSGHNLLKSLLDIVASQKKYIENPNSTFELSNLLEKSAIQASNHQSTRSISSDNTNEISNGNTNRSVSTKSPYAATRRRTVTEETTTFKKPAPTHNDDGENIEVVEKQDINIFEAPLITSFTVQQDEKGSAKKIKPIFEPTPQSAMPDRQTQSQVVFIRPEIESINTHPNSVLLPTPLNVQPVPSQSGQLSNFQSELASQSFFKPVSTKNQSLSILDKISYNQVQSEQSVFPVQQSLPLSPVITSQTQSINDFLLARQRQLEQQILQLQIQARHHQEQILLQQQLLLEQQRKQFIDSDKLNQIKSSRSSNTNVTVRPHLEILSSVTQAPRFEYSIEQQLPQLHAESFRQGFNIHNQQQQGGAIQIQASNQIPFNSPNHINPPTVPVPLEASTFQHLPQRSYQPFNLLPSPGPLNPNHSITKISPSERTPQRTRHFRQESGTGNFGFNTFLHQESLPLPFGTALNDGIRPYTPQNLPFTGQFSGLF